MSEKTYVYQQRPLTETYVYMECVQRDVCIHGVCQKRRMYTWSVSDKTYVYQQRPHTETYLRCNDMLVLLYLRVDKGKMCSERYRQRLFKDPA